MHKIKNNLLLIIPLVLVITLCFSIVFAKEQGKGRINSAEHRSAVAEFVQNLLNVADREENGIGEQVRVIAQEQNEIKNRAADAIDKIQERGKVKEFLIGTDYKNIGHLRSEMVKTRNQIEQLKRLTNRTTNEESKTELEEQIQGLEQEKTTIEDFIKTREDKFSLFGWFVKLFGL